MLSGDFAHDAILLKVEQLMKQEVREIKVQLTITKIMIFSFLGVRYKLYFSSLPSYLDSGTC